MNRAGFMRVLGLLFGFILLLAGTAASIAFGKAPIPLSEVWNALFSYDDGSREQIIIRATRLPRAYIAAAVGACLGAAGAIMQGITRNPLAGPELFGVNQGAALMIVLNLFLAGNVSAAGNIGYALAGAALAGLFVYSLGSVGRRGLTPVKLILAGSTVNLFFASIIQGILVFDEQSLDTMRFWLAGSLTGRSLQVFFSVLPFMSLGLLIAILLGRQINILHLGEEAAKGMGQRVGLVKLCSLIAVVLLAGGAVAVAGPVGFIGLAVPHIARFLIGSDYRWVLPYSMVLGALLLLLADIAARFVIPSQEIQAGVVTALLGAPFLIFLAQRRG